VNAVQPGAIRLAPPLILGADQADEFLAAWPAILDQAAVAASGGGPEPARSGAGGTALATTPPLREA
jgi:acetylornithine aminotransferase